MITHSERSRGNGTMKLFTCQLCQQEVVGIKGLNSHLQELHGARILMKCNLCEKSFMENDEFRNHLASHRSSSSVTNSLDNEPTTVCNPNASPKSILEAVSRTKSSVVASNASSRQSTKSREINTDAENEVEKLSDGVKETVIRCAQDSERSPKRPSKYAKNLKSNKTSNLPVPLASNQGCRFFSTNQVMFDCSREKASTENDLKRVETVPTDSTGIEILQGCKTAENCVELCPPSQRSNSQQSFDSGDEGMDDGNDDLDSFFPVEEDYLKVLSAQTVLSGDEPEDDNNFINNIRPISSLEAIPQYGIYPCQSCDIMFKRDDHLEAHEKVHLLRINCQFQCPKCHVFIATWKEYKKHNHRIDRRSGKPVNPDNKWLNEEGQYNPPSSSKDRRLYCKKCDRHFPTISQRVKHRQEHRNEIHHQCDFCEAKFEFKYNWAQHMLKHPENKRILCRLCGKEFKYRDDLNDHWSTKKDCDPERITCELCGKSVIRRYNSSHMSRHAGVGKRECDICGKICSDPAKLRFHRNTHFDTRGTSCKFCSYKCNNPASLHNHMSYRHLGPNGFVEVDAEGRPKPFMCQVCGECWTSELALQEHLIYHGEKSVECDKCPEVFYTKHQLRFHRTKHREYKCKHCGKTFNATDPLKIHIRCYHTGEIPYTCDHCGKGYKAKNTLMYHIRSCHTGEKRYECEMCSKRFVSKGNLNHHRRTHPDFEGAYSCFVCEEIFKVYNDMKQHSIDVHGSFKQFHRKIQV